MSRCLTCILVLNLLGWAERPLALQQAAQQVNYEGEKVAFIDLVSRPGVDVQALRPLVVQKVNEPYSNEKVQATVAALQQAGGFSRIDVDVRPEAAGLRVTFTMQPAFYVGMIYFPGATKQFHYPLLLQAVHYPSEEPYEEARVAEAQTGLTRFFATHGYFTARVEPETRFDQAHELADLIFHVTLNRRARFGRVQVKGPPANEAARLERALRSFRARLKGASLKSGKPYDPERLRAATDFIREFLSKQNLLASQVRLEQPHYDPETHRADLAFQVTLGLTVLVRVTGARVSKRKLRQLIPIFEENSFDQDLVEEGERNLISYFQSKGYFDVKVTPQTEDKPSAISVVYPIDRGNRHQVVDVAVRGNHHFDEDDLLPQVSVEKRSTFSRGKFSDELLSRSVDSLTAFYRDAGLEDVKVQPKIIDREPRVYVTFEITEGAQTLVDKLHIEGNKTQPITTLAPEGLNLKPSHPYSQSLRDQDRDQIMATYLDLGYPNTAFKSIVQPRPDDPHHVDVTYSIQEGPRTHAGDVVILGGQHTQRRFIDKNAGLQTDAPLSQGKLLEAESRLYNLGIFDWASVGPRRPITDQPQEEVLVKVHEAKRNTLSYGIGFESTPRGSNVPAGTVALPGLPVVGLPPGFRVTQQNFISPRGSIEYSRRNLRGRAETASIAALLARLDQRGSVTYANPQFRGLSWSSLLSFSAERTTENPIFTARLGQASFQIEKTLDAQKTKRLLFRYSFQRTTLTNLLIPQLVLPQDRSVRLSTLSTSYIRDTRDKPLDAHRGVYQTFDFGINPKAIGSSANFARFLGQTAYYRQIRPSLVWANDVRLGLAKSFGGSDIPLSERFFSGGANSLRGFPINGAGPQRTVPVCSNPNNPSTCTKIRVPVGGNELFILNSEVRFPLPMKKGLGGVLFYDGGNVYDRIGFSRFFTDYSNTVGFGLRYDTPVGPIRFDIGRNLNPIAGIKATQYFITFGQSF